MKLKITLTGKVHDVGYRLFLLNQADSLLINRFDARNVMVDDKQSLIILVEGDEEQVKDFLEFVKSEKPEKAVVDEIKAEEYKGSVRTIESYRNSLMLEQMNKLVQAGLGMLEKQDKTINTIREESEKTRELIEEKAEKTINVIREESEKTRGEIGGKIDLIHSDLKEYIESNLKSIREEISEIRQVLRKAGIM